MGEDTNICRLCLKFIEKDVPHSFLLNNNAVLQNLNLISFVTIKNLQLTENPLICGLCDNKLKQFAYFKENIITNEFKIQCNQKKDLNSFLEALSKDFDKICRLCLKITKDSTELCKNWKENKTTFVKCNIHLNLNIPVPSKICSSCDQTLENMWNFIFNCSVNEQRIVVLAGNKGKLCNKDLLEISSLKVENLEEQDVGEDNNNILQEQERQKEKSSSKNVLNKAQSSKEDNNVGKTTDATVNSAKSSKNVKTTGKNKAKVVNKVISKNTEKKLDNLNKNMSEENLKTRKDKLPRLFSKNTINSDPEIEESLCINKTPKVYTRAKSKTPQKNVASTSKLNIISNISLSSPIKPSTSKVTTCGARMLKIQKELSDLHSPIDVSPIRNIADITLDIVLALESNVSLETEDVEINKDNVTQELIELLEGTEELLVKEGNGSHSNNQYKDTEELLRVLEGDADGYEDIIEKPIKAVVPKTQLVQNKKNEVSVKIIPAVKKDITVKSATTLQNNTKTLENKKSPDLSKQPSVEKLKSKSSPILVVKKNVSLEKGKTIAKPKKTTTKKNKKAVESSSAQNEEKKHNLRQKTIVMSFREMLNMKPVKKKSLEDAKDPPKDQSEANNSTEKIQDQEIVSEEKKNEVEPELQNVKKRIDKKAPKKGIESKQNKISEVSSSNDNVQEKEINSKEQPSIEVTQVRVKKIVKKRNVKKLSEMKIGEHEKEPATISPQEQTGTVALEKNTSEKSENTATASPIQEVRVVGRKRGKRQTNLENQKDVVPKKRIKKSLQKTFTEEVKNLSTNSEQVNNKPDIAPGEKATETNQTNTEAQSTNSHDSDDSDEPEINHSPEKPVVVVTIIRRKKNKNKAQRDKTWLELTGKQKEIPEIPKVDDVPKKRRGRPPLPDSVKKPKKPKPVYYMCDSCPFKSISQNIILQHQYIHNVVDDVIQYKCGSCGFRTTSEDLLNQHKATHLSLELVYKCMFCEFGHKKKTSTMYHTLRHDDKDIANMFYCLVVNQMTEEEHYECFQCEYHNPEESLMPDHVIDHQIEEIKNPVVTKFSCKECSYKTKFEDTFKRHKEMHEEQKKHGKIVKKEVKKEPDEDSQDESQEDVTTVYSCDLCCYLTYNKRSLANHKGLKHTRHSQPAPSDANRPKKPSPTPNEIYYCNECPYTTTKKPHLSRHMLVHRSKENMEYFECPHCFFETKHRRSYTRHMEMRHKVIV